MWPVYGGQNGPKSIVSVAPKAELWSPLGLFGQSQKGCSRKFMPSRRSLCYWGDVTPLIQKPAHYCCTGSYGGFVTHHGRVPSPRRRDFIFPSRNCASTSPSARFAGPSPVTVLTAQPTSSRATCFLVRSMRTSSARYSVTNERIRALPLYAPRPGNGADDTSSASSAKKSATASWSLPLQASSKASAARNSSARASPWDIRSSMKRGSRFSFEAVPSEREKRERDSSITRTTICLYLPPGERSPSSSS